MKRVVVFCASVVVAILFVAARGLTAPPAPAEAPLSWELDIECQTPTPIRVQVPGDSQPSLFWFMRYTVTNRTGEDQIFAPSFVLYTDTGQSLRNGQDVPALVYDTIKKVYNAPLLRDTASITGKILQGEDNAKDGVAIWKDFDPKAGGFDIFVGGLSGETVEIKLPAPTEITLTDAMGQKITKTVDTMVLAKNLRLRYKVAGEAANRPNVTPTLESKGFVMR